MEKLSNPSITEGHIIVGADRFITVPDELKRIGVQHDHNIETVTFDCPRYWDEIDMSKGRVYINYMRSDEQVGRFLCENVTVDSSDNDIMHFDWIISGNVTEVTGMLAFLVCVTDVDANGDESFHWSSEINMDMYVSEGLRCQETILFQCPDIMTQLLSRMETVEGDNEEWKAAVELELNNWRKSTEGNLSNWEQETYSALNEHLAANEKTAKSYMESAAKSVTDAATSATNAANQATAASKSASDAAKSVTDAAGYAAEAKTARDEAMDLAESAVFTSTTTERTLTGSKAGGLKIDSIYGKSEQKSYTGKSLLPVSLKSGTTFSSLVATVSTDGVVTIKGPENGSGGRWVPVFGDGSNNTELPLSNGVYKLTFNNPSINGAFGKVSYADGTATTQSFYVENREIEFTISDEVKATNIWMTFNGNISVDATFYPMVRKADVTDNTWEPYVGGMLSPNPDYPQEIKVAGDKGNIEVKTVGENILEMTDKSSTGKGVTISVEDGVVTISGTTTDTATLVVGQFTCTRSGMVALSGGVSSKLHLYPWDNTNSKRPYTDESKTTLQSGYQYNSNGDLSFYVEEGNVYMATVRANVVGTTFDNVKLYPVVYYEDCKSTTYISTKNGLPGIPVTSSGNYTDKDGQQWVTDEIVKYADGSGKYIQRVIKLILDGTEDWQGGDNNTFVLYSEQFPTRTSVKPLCGSYIAATTTVANMPDKSIRHTYWSGQTRGFIAIRDTAYTTINDFKAGLSAKNTVCYTAIHPIVTDLSAEEVSAMRQLDTYDTVTYISTDSEVEPVIKCEYGVSAVGGHALKALNESEENAYRLDKAETVTIVTDKIDNFVVGSGYDNVGQNNGTYPVYYNFVCYHGGMFITGSGVPNNGCNYQSNNGIDWEHYSPGPNLYGNADMIYANGKYVVVGLGTGSLGVIYSTDRKSWTRGVLNTGTAQDLNAITYGNGKYIAVGNSGAIYYSTDAATWYAATLSQSTTAKFTDVTFGKGAFVAVTETGSPFYSIDGITWSASTGVTALNAITFGKDRFVAVGNSGKTAYSTDGIKWNTGSSVGSTITFNDVIYGNSKYVAVGGAGVIYISGDGINWTSVTSGISATLTSACYGDNKIVIGGVNTIICGRFVTEDKDLEFAVSEMYSKKMPYTMVKMFADNWAASGVYSGYGYKYEESISDYYDIYPEFFLKTLTTDLLPSTAEQTAFNLIGGLKLDVVNNKLQFYASSKPTTDILVIVKGVSK